MDVRILIDGVEQEIELRPFDKAWTTEYERIEALEDEEEKARRFKLLDAIQEKIGDYYVNEMEYEFRMHMKKLAERGIVFHEMENMSGYKARWSRLFASSLTKEEKRQIYYGQYRWHIFSYEKVTCLKGDEARAVFDACEKKTAYQFFQHENSGFFIENAHLLKAADMDYENTPTKSDTYLFDAEGKWTYVRTHEIYCGPYFFRKDK